VRLSRNGRVAYHDDDALHARLGAIADDLTALLRVRVDSLREADEFDAAAVSETVETARRLAWLLNELAGD
jgi:hypothetical protein